MGRSAALILLVCAIGGCSDGAPTGSAADAKKEFLAPTDMSKLTPAQQQAVAGIEKGNAAAAKRP